MILNPSLPAPSLPDAGRPYVESCTFDSATKQVKVRARTPQAGEVKNPEGEEQGFPIVDVLQSKDDVSQGGGWFVNKIQHTLRVDNKSSIVRSIILRDNTRYDIQPGEKKNIIYETTYYFGTACVMMNNFKTDGIYHTIDSRRAMVKIFYDVVYTDEF